MSTPDPPREHNLWAPWRMDYIQSIGDDDREAGPACFLCDAADHLGDRDACDQRLVIAGDNHALLMMNRYPYTNGHLLVAPLEHAAELGDLSTDTRHALMDWTDKACTLLQDTVNCQGINVGINLGRCAGAGVPGHLHVHILPRWSGDTNFMATVGKVRVIPQALEQSYQQLKTVWDA